MGAVASGEETLDENILSKGMATKLLYRMFQDPHGGKEIDTFNYRICGNQVCMHDPHNSEDFLWESLRGSVGAEHSENISDYTKSVDFPEFKVDLMDEKGKILRDYYLNTQSGIIRN